MEDINFNYLYNYLENNENDPNILSFDDFKSFGKNPNKRKRSVDSGDNRPSKHTTYTRSIDQFVYGKIGDGMIELLKTPQHQTIFNKRSPVIVNKSSIEPKHMYYFINKKTGKKAHVSMDKNTELLLPIRFPTFDVKGTVYKEHSFLRVQQQQKNKNPFCTNQQQMDEFFKKYFGILCQPPNNVNNISLIKFFKKEDYLCCKCKVKY